MDNIYLGKIKEIISNPEITEAINNNDFKTVYAAVDKNLDGRNIKIVSCLTKLLYRADIDPLLYMDKVPDYYLLDQKDITQINIPTNIKSIGWKSFSGTSIINLIIPEGVEVIDSNAFVFCQSLMTIKLPSTLKEINRMVFFDCPNITYIKYAGTKEKFKKLFEDNINTLNYKILITCQDGKIKYRKRTEEWVDIE